MQNFFIFTLKEKKMMHYNSHEGEERRLKYVSLLKSFLMSKLSFRQHHPHLSFLSASQSAPAVLLVHFKIALNHNYSITWTSIILNQ